MSEHLIIATVARRNRYQVRLLTGQPLILPLVGYS